MRPLLAGLLLCAAPLHAQEIVTLQTRPGVTQSFFIANMGGVQPKAAALMLIGGGGKPPETGPCDPLAPHGYFGKEAETVGAIAAWMLGKPYPKEIR